MKFILGTKQGMTQIFDETGKRTPVTVISAGPVAVTQLKSADKNGYAAVQFGYGERRRKNLSAPLRGHLKLSAEAKTGFRYLREFRFKTEAELGAWELGKEVNVATFAPGEPVTVSGVSKAKGFQGVVKRHGFKGGPRTHGQKHSEREPGSIGGGLRTRVPKGMRMAGRMGGERVTVKGLKVVGVSPERNELLVSGAIPGRKGTLLEIYGS
jgi:large subunit ribosomal protein L3